MTSDRSWLKTGHYYPLLPRHRVFLYAPAHREAADESRPVHEDVLNQCERLANALQKEWGLLG